MKNRPSHFQYYRFNAWQFLNKFYIFMQLTDRIRTFLQLDQSLSQQILEFLNNCRCVKCSLPASQLHIDSSKPLCFLCMSEIGGRSQSLRSLNLSGEQILRSAERVRSESVGRPLLAEIEGCINFLTSLKQNLKSRFISVDDLTSQLEPLLERLVETKANYQAPDFISKQLTVLERAKKVIQEARLEQGLSEGMKSLWSNLKRLKLELQKLSLQNPVQLKNLDKQVQTDSKVLSFNDIPGIRIEILKRRALSEFNLLQKVASRHKPKAFIQFNNSFTTFTL